MIGSACSSTASRELDTTAGTCSETTLPDNLCASWDEALDKAAEILANAKRPLFFIGSETSTEAMRVGLHLAEYLRGVADSNATI